MTVSDRIAVMDKGVVMQVATPAEIYEAPNSRYVADFIGDINILEGRVVSAGDGLTRLDCDGLAVTVAEDTRCAPGDQAAFAIRPEKVSISPDPPADTAVNAFHGEVWDIGYLGDFSVFIVRDESGRTMRAAQANVARLVDRPITFGDMVWLSWKAESGLVLTR